MGARSMRFLLALSALVVTCLALLMLGSGKAKAEAASDPSGDQEGFKVVPLCLEDVMVGQPVDESGRTGKSPEMETESFAPDVEEDLAGEDGLALTTSSQETGSLLTLADEETELGGDDSHSVDGVSAEKASQSKDSEGYTGEGAGPVSSLSAGPIPTSTPMVDPRVAVKVSYEYASDAGKINPYFELTDRQGNRIPYKRSYDPRFGTYELIFDLAVDPQDPKVNLKVTAPGYQPWLGEVTLYRNPVYAEDPDYYGYVELTMQATPAYRAGREAAALADQLLGFAQADDLLLLTTGGSVYYLGKSSEDAVEGALNHAAGRISLGTGLLLLRGTRNDPLDFVFVVKKGGYLNMCVLRAGNSQPLFVGDVSRHALTMVRWQSMVDALGRAKAFAYASLANAWAEGVPADLLQTAAFHGHLCLGTIAGYAMMEVLFRHFPPGPGGGGIEDTSYRVLGVPDGSDDDVYQWLMDATPGKRAYVGRDSVSDENMVGFIRWNNSTRTGTLVVMRYDQNRLAERFREETGVSLQEDHPAELAFNAWAVQKLLINPISLVEIILSLDALTEAECNRLTGGLGSTTTETAWGLDWGYIQQLAQTKPRAVMADPSVMPSPLTPGDIRYIGKQAAQLAVELFREELGIRLERDDPYLLALTSAGFARLFRLPTSLAWDGIHEVLGSRLTRRTLLPVHSSILGTLWFSFALLRDGKTYAVYIRYDTGTRSLVVSRTGSGNAVVDIGPETLNNNSRLREVSGVFSPHFSSIQTIANAMRYNPPFEMVLSYLFHNHVCPGVSPSWLLADLVYREFPLGENEKYIYVTTVNYCKEDGLIYLLNLSSGAGTYYNLRLLQDDSTRSSLIENGRMEGILIKWNEELKVGQAVILSFAWPVWDNTGLTTDAARREAAIGGFIMWYNGLRSPRMVAAPQVGVETAKWITQDELRAILSWSPDDPRGNVLSFVLGLPERQLSDLLPPSGGEDSDESSGQEPGMPGQPEPSEPGSPEGEEQPSIPEEGGTPEEQPSDESPESPAQEQPSQEEAREGESIPSPVTAGRRRGYSPVASFLPAVHAAANEPEAVLEEKKEASETPSPSVAEEEEEKVRAYEVEEEKETSGAGLAFLVVVGVAAFMLVGLGGYLLAGRRRL